MKIFLVHHAHCFTADENPDRPLTEKGRAQADRIGAHLNSVAAAPVHILHSGKTWTHETAERISAAMGGRATPKVPPYPIFNDSDVRPFVEEAMSAAGDIVMTGHSDFLRRAGSLLLCGDQSARVIECKPGHGSIFCLEGRADDWAVAYALRQEHMVP